MVEGLQLDRGYLSPYFVTDPERMEAVLEDVSFSSMTRRSPRSGHPAHPREGRADRPSALIIAEDMEGGARDARGEQLLASSRPAPKAPGFGDAAGPLEDIAILTGGRLVTEEAGFKPRTRSSPTSARRSASS